MLLQRPPRRPNERRKLTLSLDENLGGPHIREGEAFYLRRDLGGCYLLELQRTPVDLVEKWVRLVGTLVAPDLVSADGVAPA